MLEIGDGIVWTYNDDNRLHEQLGLECREPDFYRVHNIKPVFGPDKGIVTLENIIDGNLETWLYLQHLEYAIERKNILHIPKEPIEIKQKITPWKVS